MSAKPHTREDKQASLKTADSKKYVQQQRLNLISVMGQDNFRNVTLVFSCKKTKIYIKLKWLETKSTKTPHPTIEIPLHSPLVLSTSTGLY